MSTFRRRILVLAICAPSMLAASAAPDDDDDKPAPAAAGAPATQSAPAPMTPAERHAGGISVAHPVRATLPDRVQSVGVVLDTAELISDLGEMTALSAAERSTRAEVARLQALYAAGAGASLKMLEAARTEEAKAAAQSRLTAARFDQHWGPLAKMPATKRQRLLGAVAHGRLLLLRANVPGRHSLGSLPESAELDVDGISVPGQVLGVLRQADETQGVGLLIGIGQIPAGLGPGARVPVALVSAKHKGLLVPREALLYDEKGAYVFKELTGPPAAQNPDPGGMRYARVNVTLLLRQGDGWLVDGIDDDDNIVVAGTGVLWSLQGSNARVAAADDDD